MAEKRIRATIASDGNSYKIETMEGFVGNSCETTINAVCAGLGGSVIDEGDKDDRYRNEEADAFVFRES